MHSQRGTQDPGADPAGWGRFPGFGPRPLRWPRRQRRASWASWAQVGGEGTSVASSPWLGRKGDKGPKAAGLMRGRSGAALSHRARDAREAVAGAQAGGAAAAAGLRAGGAPGKALAPQWRRTSRPITGRACSFPGSGRPPRGFRGRQPRCASPVQF